MLFTFSVGVRYNSMDVSRCVNNKVAAKFGRRRRRAGRESERKSRRKCERKRNWPTTCNVGCYLNTQTTPQTSVANNNNKTTTTTTTRVSSPARLMGANLGAARATRRPQMGGRICGDLRILLTPSLRPTRRPPPPEVIHDHSHHTHTHRQTDGQTGGAGRAGSRATIADTAAYSTRWSD